ncbi:LacI family DNA-binding transcriptional regulator [Brachybacterium sp. AOP25-B2-12]|uniref:LacI family DNA-binding transcriptional regulator n=1 Tax=Brachybacterium sp. AOP25-B2-12 TaxID=3457710 RepID=UPI0040349F3A
MPNPRTTIGDVARAAGVSKGTVSLAYSGKRPVAPATRQRILDAAEALRWNPSHSARALATSRTGAIGLVIRRRPEVLADDRFFPSFIAGAESVLAGADMGLMLHIVGDVEAETAVYERLAAGRVDGVILLDVEVADRRIALLEELGLPAVMLVAQAPAALPPGDVPVAYTDDASAVTELVDRLVASGHRRIAHASGPLGYVHAAARRDAFVAALHTHGLDASAVVEGDFTAASGRDATAALLDAPDRPSAIVYANDIMAIAGLSLARSRGLRVPEDLSITGFDDSELSAHLSPALTTVATDARARGEAVTAMLIDRIGREGSTAEDRSAPAPCLLECTRVVVRDSIAPPQGAPAP